MSEATDVFRITVSFPHVNEVLRLSSW